MARHDVLTGLPNRRRFIEDFNRSAEHLPPGEACALFVLDLDNFKPINDVYGHRLGDEVLKVVSHRLTQIAEGASVARLGGDEFGVTLRYRAGSDAARALGAPDRSRAFAADPARRSVAPGRRQRRRRDLRYAGLWRYRHGEHGRARRRRGRDHASPRRHGDVLGESRWPRALPLLRSQHGREIAPASRARIPDRRRDHFRPDRTLLSADRSPRGRRDHRLRGACALGASAARRAHVRCLHSHRRGHRNDRQDDRSAARARHARRQGLARASLGFRQFLAAADLRP